MASADRFTINVYGKSSHGGEPQRGVDAIAAACQLVTALLDSGKPRQTPMKR